MKRDDFMLISKFKRADINEEIRALEEKCDCVFPEHYRQFLEKYNGGYTPKTSFRARESSDVRGFYGVSDAKMNFDEIELDDWLPEKVIPIATDCFGNYIVIGIKDRRYGKVYFSDHELNWKLTNIAPDFKAFVKLCKSHKIGHIRSIEEREAALIANGYAENITDGIKKMWQEEIDKYKEIVQETVSIK